MVTVGEVHSHWGMGGIVHFPQGTRQYHRGLRSHCERDFALSALAPFVMKLVPAICKARFFMPWIEGFEFSFLLV
jgi:hypothetical protein